MQEQLWKIGHDLPKRFLPERWLSYQGFQKVHDCQPGTDADQIAPGQRIKNDGIITLCRNQLWNDQVSHKIGSQDHERHVITMPVNDLINFLIFLDCIPVEEYDGNNHPEQDMA